MDKKLKFNLPFGFLNPKKTTTTIFGPIDSTTYA